MRYKLALFLRFFSGFLFYTTYFVSTYKFIVNQSFPFLYIVSVLMAIAYLFFSYQVSYYNMHYFFEFIKELRLKVIMIVVMYAFVFFVYKALPVVFATENRLLFVFFFLTFYIAFDLVSEIAIISTSYRKSIDVNQYIYKMQDIATKDAMLAAEGLLDINYNLNYKLKKTNWFYNFYVKYINTIVENCFVNREGDCFGVYDKLFYQKLIEFSKENQTFFGVNVDNPNYILDCRCNIVCISENEFSFIDSNGAKCIINRKIERIF